jgi:hypothetical protein
MTSANDGAVSINAVEPRMLQVQLTLAGDYTHNQMVMSVMGVFHQPSARTALRPLSVEFVDWLLRFFRMLRLFFRFNRSSFSLHRGAAKDSVQQVALSRQCPNAIRQTRIERRDYCHLFYYADRINTTKARSKRGRCSLDDKKVVESD